MNKVCIVSIVYHEPEWQETKKCIEALNVPVIYAERDPKGVGSLAEAINRGFAESVALAEFKYVWFVTNCTFIPRMLKEMIEYMDLYPSCPAIHPCFDSDHQHLRQNINTEGSHEFMTYVPFIEFTAPLVRTSIFREFLLDENMPYVGHDLDWSYRIRERLTQVPAVYHGEKLGHTYIRKKRQFNPYTRARKRARQQADQSTIRALENKYGKNWRDLMQYHNGIAS